MNHKKLYLKFLDQKKSYEDFLTQRCVAYLRQVNRFLNNNKELAATELAAYFFLSYKNRAYFKLKSFDPNSMGNIVFEAINNKERIPTMVITIPVDWIFGDSDILPQYFFDLLDNEEE